MSDYLKVRLASASKDAENYRKQIDKLNHWLVSFSTEENAVNFYLDYNGMYYHLKTTVLPSLGPQWEEAELLWSSDKDYTITVYGPNGASWKGVVGLPYSPNQKTNLSAKTQH